MKDLSLIMLVWIIIGIILFLLAATAYGVYLAFTASIFIGLVSVLVLIPIPIPTLIGIIALLGHPELCRKIAMLLGL